MSIHLILGGARSGKSGHAESLAIKSSKEVVYLATASAEDTEMQARIQKHQQDRPQHWQTLEIQTGLAEVVQSYVKTHCIIVDCLTLWMMNCFQDYPEINMSEVTALEALIEELSADTEADIILVSNEISMGVVPLGELNRDYIDVLGRHHQAIARFAHQVTLMVAGIPMQVK